MLLELNTSADDEQTLPEHKQPKIILTTQLEIHQLSALLDLPIAEKLLQTDNWNALRTFLDELAVMGEIVDMDDEFSEAALEWAQSTCEGKK